MIFKTCHSNRNYPDINICIDDVMIKRVSHTKFLGVIFDETMTWSNHTRHITTIVWKYTGTLFCFKAIDRIHIIIRQKRIMRLCTNSHWLAHSPPLFKNCNTLNVYDIHT